MKRPVRAPRSGGSGIQGKGKGEAWKRAWKKRERSQISIQHLAAALLGARFTEPLYTGPHGNLQSRVPHPPRSTTKKTSLIKSQSESTDVITHRSLSPRLHISTRCVCVVVVVVVVFHSDPGLWLRQETQKENKSHIQTGLGSLSVLSGVAIVVPTTPWFS